VLELRKTMSATVDKLHQQIQRQEADLQTHRGELQGLETRLSALSGGRGVVAPLARNGGGGGASGGGGADDAEDGNPAELKRAKHR
jgi:hypothetical protein